MQTESRSAYGTFGLGEAKLNILFITKIILPHNIRFYFHF